MIKRTVTAFALIGVLFAVLFFGGYVQLAAFTFAAVISVYEFSQLFRAKGYAPFLWGSYVFAALLFLIEQLFALRYVAVLGLACILVPMVERIFNPKRTTEDAICSLFVFIYPLLFYVILMVTATMEDFAISRTALLLSFAGPLMGDTMALLAGSLLGKHKLCPAISPKKTVEGSVGGLIGGVLGGLLVFYIQRLFGAAVPLLPLLIMGLIMGALGQVGDLYASTMKRWAGVKDYGNLFPGHGGVMDRLDSVLLCAPIAMIYFKVILGLA